MSILKWFQPALCFAGMHDDRLVAKWTDKEYALILSEYVCAGCGRRRMYVELFEPKRCPLMSRISLDAKHTFTLDAVNTYADIMKEADEQTNAESKATETKKRSRKPRKKVSATQDNK